MLPTKFKSGLYQSNTMHLKIKFICFSFLKNVSCSEHWSLLSRTSTTSQSTIEIKMSVALGVYTDNQLFIYSLLSDTANVSHHTASNGGMNCE